MAESKPSGLKAAEEAIKAIKASAAEVSCLFQETFAIRGSKTCSLKCKPAASTNHPFCPNLTGLVPDSQVPENVNCVYEIVVNGLTLEAVKKALSKGLKAAASGPGVVKISAGNYGGKLGPYKAYLKELLELWWRRFPNSYLSLHNVAYD